MKIVKSIPIALVSLLLASTLAASAQASPALREGRTYTFKWTVKTRLKIKGYTVSSEHTWVFKMVIKEVSGNKITYDI